MAIDARQQLKALWKETFHDTDEYISLVFDNQFNPELACWYSEKGRIVSGLIGVPYTFTINNNKLKGLYLCGLATNPAFRNRGIMRGLIEHINRKALLKGFDFTFLIPANSGLTKFYEDSGYVSSFYVTEEYYTSVHKFMLDKIIENIDTYNVEILSRNLYIKNNHLRYKYINHDLVNTNIQKNDDNNLQKITYNMSDIIIDDIIDFIMKINTNNDSIKLTHTKEEWILIFKEINISNGIIFILRDSQNNISSVAIVDIQDEKKLVVVKDEFSIGGANINLLRQYIKNYCPQYGMRIICDHVLEDNSHIAFDYFLDQENEFDYSETIKKNLSISQGMIRILSFCQILKFISIPLRDFKYSILVKEEMATSEDNISDAVIQYSYKNGVFNNEIVDNTRGSKKTFVSRNLSRCQILTSREFASLLCRKEDYPDYVQDAFGLPKAKFRMRFLLE